MKGPALQYDVRALRVFVCDACGRQCPLPGRFTSCQCHCAVPPRWMRLLDRQRVTVPDVSRFISPADPAETEVDENESDEVIPGWKPPVFERPSQAPQRRRLSEDADRMTQTASEQASAEDPGFGGQAAAGFGENSLGTSGPPETSPAGRSGYAARGERTHSRDSRGPRRDRRFDPSRDRSQRGPGAGAGRGPGDQRAAHQPPQSQQPPGQTAPQSSAMDDFGSGVDADSLAAGPPEVENHQSGADRPGDRDARRGRRRGRRGPGPNSARPAADA